jgi:RNase H-like domain found in reverse transcriptase/Reverse transcriptase (RNA-dependent DNA polymerase)/Integrase zinc binding domain
LNVLDRCINEALDINSLLVRRARGHPIIKRQKLDHESPLIPIVFATVMDKPERMFKVLLDSGASGSIASSASMPISLPHNLKDYSGNSSATNDRTVWNTAAGSFTTVTKTTMDLIFPEFSLTRVVHAELHITDQTLSGYDMILGRDMLSELGLVLDFSRNMIIWESGEMPMKVRGATRENSLFIKEPVPLMHEAERMSKILDAKYKKADLRKIADSVKGVNDEQREQLYQFLQLYEGLFDGTLGKWKGKEYHIELKEGAKPFHARPYSVPRAYELTFRREVERLVNIGVLKKVNRSEWAAPTFLIPKKDHTVRFISDFRELNKRIKRKPFPIPKIQDMLLKLEGFQWATSLDLNMGYYHIRLDPMSRTYCTIVLPWGKYEYQALPMGLCNSPDIFQENMSELMEGLQFVRTYIDDLLVVTNGSFSDHLEKLGEVLDRVETAGLKINAEKSFFCQQELEYLGYWITREGIMPVPKKTQAMLAITAPTTRKELRRFIGLVNYYRDMWIRRSDVLAPLSRLLSKDTKWQWTSVEANAFDQIKRIIAKNVLLSHPDFNKPFEIHTDASKYQLGAVISQEAKPIAFYSRKLSKTQLNYTTTERELLAIVETLKEFRNILLGQQVIVYTDHQNLTYKVFNVERVMRWRLIIEQFGVELRYIKGSNNIVADALSRLGLEPALKSESDLSVLDKPDTRLLAEAFRTEDDITEDDFPLHFKLIQREQQNDKALLTKVRQSNNYSITNFRGGGTERQLITRNGKIIIPRVLQKRIVRWYHYILCHPGESRTEATIAQHFHWAGMREHIKSECSTCHICQLTKRTKKKYGHLPPKEAEATPWERLCVDMIGPYIIKRKGKKTLTLWCVTMIDPATGWFEIKDVPGTKRADVVANIVETTWLGRYPWPQIVTLDRGTEFMAEFSKMMVDDYGVKKKPITKRNPQANAIVERVHQTIGNMIRTFSVADNPDIVENDPWTGILNAVAFAVRATVHTTSQATPMQLVFGRDAILNIPMQANWKHIEQRKQALIIANNRRENSKRIPHQYRVGDQVLVKKEWDSKYGSDAYKGPFDIVEVRNNGTVRIREGRITDTYNIRMITPYHRRS